MGVAHGLRDEAVTRAKLNAQRNGSGLALLGERGAGLKRSVQLAVSLRQCGKPQALADPQKVFVLH